MEEVARPVQPRRRGERGRWQPHGGEAAEDTAEDRLEQGLPAERLAIAALERLLQRDEGGGQGCVPPEAAAEVRGRGRPVERVFEHIRKGGSRDVRRFEVLEPLG